MEPFLKALTLRTRSTISKQRHGDCEAGNHHNENCLNYYAQEHCIALVRTLQNPSSRGQNQELFLLIWHKSRFGCTQPVKIYFVVATSIAKIRQIDCFYHVFIQVFALASSFAKRLFGRRSGSRIGCDGTRSRPMLRQKGSSGPRMESW